MAASDGTRYSPSQIGAFVLTKMKETAGKAQLNQLNLVCVCVCVCVRACVRVCICGVYVVCMCVGGRCDILA